MNFFDNLYTLSSTGLVEQIFNLFTGDNGLTDLAGAISDLIGLIN